MSRRVVQRWLALAFTGVALAGLAACGSLYRTVEREPWRAQVEAACLASGQVRETAGIRLGKAIEGPGVCGVDHPFRVSSLDSILTGSSQFLSLRSPPQTTTRLAPMQAPPMQLPGADGEDPFVPVGPAPAAPLSSVSPPIPAGFTPLPDLPASAPPVQLQADGPFMVSLDRSVTLSCAMVPALQAWLTRSVQPAAMAAFGSPIVEMTSFGTYSCRRMDNRRVGRMSEHAFANAIDVKGFQLANGREVRILTGWRGAPDEQGFWHDIAYGACTSFTTVLGPGSSDGLHENHLHLDLARHSSGDVHVCRPRVPQGWVPLAMRGGQGAEPAYTGSIETPLRGEDED